MATLGNEQNGIRHPLQYSVVAGDARVGPFDVTVQRIPVVSIRSVTYQPASYTRLLPRVTQRGAINGLEGTDVTIVAESNLPLAQGKIEYNPKRIGSQLQATGGVKAMTLSADGRTLTTSLTLRQPSDEVGVVAVENYRIVVKDLQGNSNPSSVIYPVQVSADLAPEVTIIVPEQSPKDLPIEMEQVVEVHALDPDFGLSRMEFEVRKGKRVLGTRKIFESEEPFIGQQISLSTFRARDWNLVVGDTVTVRCRAFDNRDMPGNDTLDPNQTLSDAIELRIVAMPEDPPAEGDGDGMQASRRDDGNQQGDAQQGGQEGSGGSGGEGAAAEGTPQGKGESGGSGSESGEQGEKSGEGKDGKNSGEGGKPASDDPNESGGNGNQAGDGSSEPGNNPSESDSGSDGNSDPNQPPGDGGAEGDGGAAGAEGNPAGESGEMQNSDSPTEGGTPTGDARSGGDAKGNGSKQGNPSDGSSPSQGGDPSGEDAGQDDGPLHDGEIIERIREHMKQQSKQGAGNQGGAGEEQATDAESQPSGESADSGPPGEQENDSARGDGDSKQDPTTQEKGERVGF